MNVNAKKNKEKINKSGDESRHNATKIVIFIFANPYHIVKSARVCMILFI